MRPGNELPMDVATGTHHLEKDTTLPSVDDLFRCSKALKVLLLRMTGDVDLTKDLTQDVLAQVLQAIRERRVHSTQALPGYIHTCARRAVITHSRKTKRVVLDNAADIIETDATPLDAYEKHQFAEMAQQVLAELHSERDRGLIYGFYVEGKTKQALMQLWQLENHLFDKVLSRARIRMRELMHEKLNENTSKASALASSRLFKQKEEK
jgi:RNA polymerase sigma factor (sigma-70 family)